MGASHWPNNKSIEWLLQSWRCIVNFDIATQFGVVCEQLLYKNTTTNGVNVKTGNNMGHRTRSFEKPTYPPYANGQKITDDDTLRPVHQETNNPFKE
jgi:hypothetical protein